VEAKQSDGMIMGWRALQARAGMCKHSIKTRMIHGDFPLPISGPRKRGELAVWSESLVASWLSRNSACAKPRSRLYHVGTTKEAHNGRKDNESVEEENRQQKQKDDESRRESKG